MSDSAKQKSPPRKRSEHEIWLQIQSRRCSLDDISRRVGLRPTLTLCSSRGSLVTWRRGFTSRGEINASIRRLLMGTTPADFKRVSRVKGECTVVLGLYEETPVSTFDLDTQSLGLLSSRGLALIIRRFGMAEIAKIAREVEAEVRTSRPNAS